ncbi:MAG: hypothetical protein E6H84_12205 [Chloroflexi bacterium]|nr:MAG: hypothetical protein E6H84_12205 [Chloroflexota bacterium]TMG71032.1 MAG: hypothetical protein E6H81_05530 [Chloroflexota bacterium]
MKPVAGALGIVWALVNLILAYYFLADAFIAKTAAREGILAQASLLLGGLLMGLFALLVARVGVRLIRAGNAT